MNDRLFIKIAAVIDYDTSTSIREYRYISSNEEITDDDLKKILGKWTVMDLTNLYKH